MRIFSGLRVILFGMLCAAATLVARAGETVYHSDVVVLGSGAAGLSAAVAAAETGAKVMVLEKMPVVGGSSVFAADYVSAIGKRAEAVVGKELSVESLYEEIVKSGGGRNDPELIEKLLLMTDDAYEWLTSMGASLALSVPVREGGDWAGFRTDTKGPWAWKLSRPSCAAPKTVAFPSKRLRPLRKSLWKRAPSRAFASPTCEAEPSSSARPRS